MVSDEEFATVLSQLADLRLKNHIFPADDLLELAAEAIEESVATPDHPIYYDGVREVLSAELPFGERWSTTGAITPFLRPP